MFLFKEYNIIFSCQYLYFPYYKNNQYLYRYIYYFKNKKDIDFLKNTTIN